MPDFINLYAGALLCLCVAAGAFVMGRTSRAAVTRAKVWFCAAVVSASAIPILFFAIHPYSLGWRIAGEIAAGAILGLMLWGMFLEIEHKEPDDAD